MHLCIIAFMPVCTLVVDIWLCRRAEHLANSALIQCCGREHYNSQSPLAHRSNCIICSTGVIAHTSWSSAQWTLTAQGFPLMLVCLAFGAPKSYREPCVKVGTCVSTASWRIQPVVPQPFKISPLFGWRGWQSNYITLWLELSDGILILSNRTRAGIWFPCACANADGMVFREPKESWLLVFVWIVLFPVNDFIAHKGHVY